MRPIVAALVAGLLLCAPALAQPSAQARADGALRAAEGELREALQGMDDGTLGGSMAVSRMRQAMNEVERAMLQMPADARQGTPWQSAVKEVSEAMALMREDGAEREAVRAAAAEALGTLPALRGEETGAEGGQPR